MIFIIDKDIYFRPDDGAIWRLGSEQEKKYLTPANSRLLRFLIEEQGKILSRNDIFIAVWDKHGLHSSNHTLNQYISYLRKTFTDFGLTTPLIKTLPKIGFIFSGDVSVAVDNIPTTHSDAPLAGAKPARRRFLPVAGLFILLVCGLLLFMLARNKQRWDFHIDYQEAAQRYENCRVLHFRTGGISRPPPFSLLGPLIETMGIDCRQDAWIILQDADNLSDKRFAAVCRRETEGRSFTSCQSHYQYD